MQDGILEKKIPIDAVRKELGRSAFHELVLGAHIFR